MELIRTKQPDLSSIVFADFQKFVVENGKNFKDNSIVSFAFPIKNINLISTLNSLNREYKQVFFYKCANDKYSYIAINQIRELPFESGKISQLASEISDLQSNIVKNWNDYELGNVPLLTGAVNFSSDNFNNDWNDFGTSKLILPEIIIYQHLDRTYLLYNYLISSTSNFDGHSNRIDQIIKSVLTASQTTINNSVFRIYRNGKDENAKTVWDNVINDAKIYLKSSLNKIVLSRKIEVETTDEVNWSNLISKLNNENPESFIYMYKSNDSIFFGASPEKFISIQDNIIDIDAMAGSAARDSKDVANELLNNKNLKEHKFVTDFICDTLSEYAEKVVAAEQPLVIKLSDVQHLHTKISAQLQSKEKVLSLIDSLYPTPAVCGIPKDGALKAISELETHDRGLYSGLIGWINQDLNCEFAVAIRSAFYKNSKLNIYAGSGIVEESVSEDEFLETELKLKTILKLFDEKNPH